MALNVNLQALLVPDGTEFPGTVQDFLDLIAQYMEITGLEDFNGVNYGATEPAAEDRDKAWFKTDGSGTPLGWYTWNGTAWVVLPAKATVGNLAARDAILTPQDGQLFHLIGTGLYAWVESEAEWQAAAPAPVPGASYDKSFFFESYQQLASISGSVSSWTEVDLTDFIADAGLTTVKGAYIAVEVAFPDQGFGGPQTYTVALRVTQDNTVSTSSNALLKALAQGTRDDSRTSAAAQNSGVLPLPTNSIYYSASSTASGTTGTVWLMGFLY